MKYSNNIIWWAVHQPFVSLTSVTLFYTDDHRIPSNITHRNILGKGEVKAQNKKQ